MILSTKDLDLKLRPRRKDDVHGEWDAWRALTPHVRRRLTGMRVAGVKGGLAPDQLAEELNDRYGMNLSTCDALELWASEVERLLDERRANKTGRRNGATRPAALLATTLSGRAAPSPPAAKQVVICFRAGGAMADYTPPTPEWEF